MHTIKITPNLLFEYQCTSGKFIRLPNRIESKLFLPELECSRKHYRSIHKSCGKDKGNQRLCHHASCVQREKNRVMDWDGVRVIEKDQTRLADSSARQCGSETATIRIRQGKMTSQDLRSRYVRHFVGITWRNVWS